MQEKISWKTAEHLHTEKSSDWYWIVGIVTISIALISIILNNLIFAILIIVASFTLSLFASRKPEIIDIEIDEKGISIGEINHPYKDLDSFWVESHDGNPRILLKPKKFFSTYTVAIIQDVEPEKVREAVGQYLEEEEHTEPFLEKLLLYFGF